MFGKTVVKRSCKSEASLAFASQSRDNFYVIYLYLTTFNSEWSTLYTVITYDTITIQIVQIFEDRQNNKYSTWQNYNSQPMLQLLIVQRLSFST